MASQTKTGKFNKKILAAIIIIIVVVASASAAALYVTSQKSKTSNPTLPTMTLTLTGASGQQKVLTQTDIAAMKAYTSKGGFETSGGLISETGTYTGVQVTAFLDLVGGITSGQTLEVTASDGYSMTFTYNQVANGQDFTTFDPTTGSQTSSTQALQMVLAYYVNGTLFASGEGPLRLAILGSQGLLTQGRCWVKMVTGLQVVSSSSTSTPTPTPTASPTASVSPVTTVAPTATPWSITVNGTTAVTMSESTFDGLVLHNSVSYADSTTTWTGMPLLQFVTWAENNGVISSSALTSGYVVEVIGQGGYTRAFNDSRIIANDLIVADVANNAVLTGSYAPLTLEGSGLTSSEKVAGITQIRIVPIQDCSITIVAANGSQVTLFSNDLAMMPSVTYYGGTWKNGAVINNGNYTGVPLLDLCNIVGGITSSNTVTVTGSDGYTVSYNYTEVASGTGFSTFNDSGTSTSPTQPLYLILAYWLNGVNLPTKAAGGAGPLKTMLVGADGLNTFGNIAAKYVVQIKIS